MGKNKEEKKGGIGKFLLGAAVGAGLGVLFAPQKGSETRKQLKEKFDELLDKVKNIDAQDVKENIERKIEEIKAELADLDAEKVMAVAKQKAKAISKKADELVKLAIKKGTPVLQKAAEDVRNKTIEVLSEIIDKLESGRKEEPPAPKKAAPKKKTN